MKLSPAPSSAAADPVAAALFSIALLLATPAAAIDCKNIVVDGQKFDFHDLSGPHSVITWQQHEAPWKFVNTTYTLDLCRPLRKKVGPDDGCPNGARVCGIKRATRPDQDDYEVIEVRAIAGDLGAQGGSPAGLDEHVTRLRQTADAKTTTTGVRIALSGGRWPLARGGRAQRAVVDMLCDPGMAGTEGEVDPTGEWLAAEERTASRPRRRADSGDEDGPPEHQLWKEARNKTALRFESYGPVADDVDVDVLRLTWHTRLACEDEDQKGGGHAGPGGADSSERWGFFTWLFVIVFMGTAAYLIFGSWLNYNRYGARGWDLLPHGDTIRDIPYLLKDWIRRVMNTVQGTGSRGGYSAV